MTDIEKVSTWAFVTWIVISRADISHVKEGEIVVLAYENPIPFGQIHDWDGKLKAVEPRHGDLGLDNKRNVYRYTGKEWQLTSKEKECE